MKIIILISLIALIASRLNKKTLIAKKPGNDKYIQGHTNENGVKIKFNIPLIESQIVSGESLYQSCIKKNDSQLSKEEQQICVFMESSLINKSETLKEEYFIKPDKSIYEDFIKRKEKLDSLIGDCEHNLPKVERNDILTSTRKDIIEHYLTSYTKMYSVVYYNVHFKKVDDDEKEKLIELMMKLSKNFSIRKQMLDLCNSIDAKPDQYVTFSQDIHGNVVIQRKK